MTPKLVIVDLDGTLFDTVGVNGEAYRRALAGAGYDLPPEYYAAHCDGHYYLDFLPGLMPGADRAAIERVHDRKLALYSECLPAARRNEALFAILEALRPACRLAMVTTATRKNVEEILALFNCRDWFDLILTNAEVTKPKPDPEGFLTAMAHFGVTPAETVIFEDSETGLAAARASGAAVFKVEHF